MPLYLSQVAYNEEGCKRSFQIRKTVWKQSARW